jgi:hypothetical protein
MECIRKQGDAVAWTETNDLTRFDVLQNSVAKNSDLVGTGQITVHVRSEYLYGEAGTRFQRTAGDDILDLGIVPVQGRFGKKEPLMRKQARQPGAGGAWFVCGRCHAETLHRRLEICYQVQGAPGSNRPSTFAYGFARTSFG